MRQYRAKRNLEFARLNNALDQLTRNNTQTRRKFDETVGDDWWVIVSSELGDQFHDFSGYVMGFLPSYRICVVDEKRRIVTVPPKQVASALENRVISIEKGVVRLLPERERSEQLLGEAATRPGVEISLEDVQQMELGLVTKRQDDAALPPKPKRGQKVNAVQGQAQAEATFTPLDRIHRAMLLFGLGRSTLLRQVLEKELRQSKRFERSALSLNALYPDGSDERRMLEGVQAAMRGVK
jgi:hypothetical protein